VTVRYRAGTRTVGKQREPGSSTRTMRTHRPSSFVPYWVRIVGGLAAVLVIGTWSFATFRLYRSGAMTCQRCGAVESGPEVLGLWLGTERPASPGRALVERVAGRCATHRYEATGCWSYWSGVGCTMRPTGEQAYEICALAGGEIASRLAVRLVERTAGERETILFDALFSGEYEIDTAEEARRWIAAVVERQGWHDLEAR
jgi:hypothetical protein